MTLEEILEYILSSVPERCTRLTGIPYVIKSAAHSREDGWLRCNAELRKIA